MSTSLPWRGEPPARPPAPVDLRAMPVLLDGRLRKRWRYVGVFDDRLLLCAGVAEIGVARQAFWAVWDRQGRTLHERTRLWRGHRYVRLPRGRVELADGAVHASLQVEPGGRPVETASPVGAAWIWTRKSGDVRVRGRVVLGGEAIELDARGCVDESAGFHARATRWRWSAGVGDLADGRPVAWNLVAGLHDDPVASERTAWVDGVPVQAPPVTFAPDLGSVRFATGEALTFAAEAVRRRRDDLGLVRSDLEQPFGTFAGTLPGAGVLARGLGVMERHEALW